MNNEKKVVGLYIRVSTEDQAREGLVYQSKKNALEQCVSIKVMKL